MSEFWKVIRNLAALVGLIVSCILLYNHFIVNKYDLKAIADTNEYHVMTSSNAYVDEYSNYMISQLNLKDLTRNQQTIINISNDGDNEVRDIYLLKHGMNCTYQFQDSEGKLKTGQSTSKIALGNLLSNEKMKIIVWHGYLFSNDEFSLSFPEGSFEIEYSERFNGFIAKVASFIETMDIWIVLMILPFLLGLIPSNKKSENIEDVNETKEVEKE